MTNDEDTYDALAKSLSSALDESSATVSSSIRDIAKSVSQGTHSLMHAIAISDEGQAPDEKSELPLYKKTPNAQVPYGYVPQAPPMASGYMPQMPQVSTEPILTQLKRLRA